MSIIDGLELDELRDQAAKVPALEAEIERLKHNQITADYVRVSQAAAFQAQEADAQARYAKTLEEKCDQLTNALLRAMTLVDELMRENIRLCAASNEPPNVKLFTAKNGFDAAMKRLLSPP